MVRSSAFIALSLPLFPADTNGCLGSLWPKFGADHHDLAQKLGRISLLHQRLSDTESPSLAHLLALLCAIYRPTEPNQNTVTWQLEAGSERLA